MLTAKFGSIVIGIGNISVFLTKMPYNCHTIHDRDINASINILNKADDNHWQVSSISNLKACGVYIKPKFNNKRSER